jgi:hypothetical protein
MNEVTIIGFKNSNGIRIAPNSDITTGKVIINGIEITSTEDWEKVTKSLIELEHNWNELKKWLEDENNQKYSQYIYNYSINDWVLNKIKELEEGGNNENN